MLKFVNVPLTQFEFEALLSATFNLGRHLLDGTGFIEMLNAKAYDAAWRRLLLYCHDNGQVLEGLVRRRKAEYDLAVNEKLPKSFDLESFSVSSLH